MRTSSSDAIRQQQLSSAEAWLLPPAAELVLRDACLQVTAQPGCLVTVLLVSIPLLHKGNVSSPGSSSPREAWDARSGRESRMCSRVELPAVPKHPRPVPGPPMETTSPCGLTLAPSQGGNYTAVMDTPNVCRSIRIACLSWCRKPWQV